MAYIGQAIPRQDHLRLTTGRGRYVSDIVLPGMLHLAIVRSTRAHARIQALDLEAARRQPGVVGVFGPDDIRPVMRPIPSSPADPAVDAFQPTALADGVVRYVGEPVAAVLAENRYLAEDAAELVEVTYDPLPAVVDAEKADELGVLLFPGHGSNVVAKIGFRVGRGKEALQEADLVVETRLRLGRVVAHAMEPRAVVAHYDPETETIQVYAATQSVHRFRECLAEVLDIDPSRLRVIAPDVGGGFGVKNRVYPEDVLAAYLSLLWKRPVKWNGDRREEFLSTNQERDQVHHAAIGLRRDGTIVAVYDSFIQDNGAYCVSGLVVPTTTGVSLPGPYRVPNLEVEGRVVVTNKVPIAPYRGAGRPQGTFVMERLLDFAADALQMDRLEIRRRNLIRPEDLPYRPGVMFRGTPLEIQEGDFPKLMADAVQLADLPGLRHEQAKLRSEGRLIGIGVSNYLELSAGGGFEGARIRLLPDGVLEIATGAASQGQGHSTMLAQIAADRLGLPLEQIRVVEGDTAHIARGIGTFGSRTTVMAGNAVSIASRTFRQKVLQMAAERLEAPLTDLVWENGRIYVQGVPSRPVTLADLAADEATRQRLTVEHYFHSDQAACGMGTHVVVIELDPETLAIQFRKYVIVHDAGVVVNPLSAEGQTIGAAVQGLGTALYEELHVNLDGQPENTSFMDYLLPGAVEMPDFEVHEELFPAVANPEGFKGLAEGGIMPPMSAVLSAIEDALAIPGLRLEEIPVTPAKLYSWLSARGVRS